MNNIQVFNNPEFGDIRTVEIDGEVWFVGKDVATALGYAKTENAIARHVDKEDKTLTPFQGGCSTGIQKMTIINESGLYALTMSSKLPSAKKFKHWVTSEVLPTIRKTGAFMSSRKRRYLNLNRITDTCCRIKNTERSLFFRTFAFQKGLEVIATLQ